MRKSGTPTKYAGVLKIEEKVFRVRGAVKDPRTGRKKEVDRVLHGVTARQASSQRALLLEQTLDNATELTTTRMTVGAYATLWLKRKITRKEISDDTALIYAAALEDHVLPALGCLYYDTVRQSHVQDWIDRSLDSTWVTSKRRPRGHGKAKCRRNQRGKCEQRCSCARDAQKKPYAVATVQGWFRVLRTMTKDAVGELRLNCDPTLRVRFEQVSGGKNSLKEHQLVRFLAAMKAEFPQHYGLVVLLAYTGLRFCHASALRWDDWDEGDEVLTVVRKNTRSGVGPISRKKRVPQEYPVEPEIAEVLQWHRRRMIRKQLPGIESGFMFPSATGTLRRPSSLYKAWSACLERAEISQRFTPHGMRYTFSNLLRRAKVDKIARRALTGHVTEEMQLHYEDDVELGEKRSAVAGVIRLAPLRVDGRGGDPGGDHPENEERPAR